MSPTVVVPLSKILFPDLFSQTPNFEKTKSQILGEQTSQTQGTKSLTIATFKDGSFHPSKVWMKKGYYVGIKNEDEKSQMWLMSDEETLRTLRGYGFGEQLRSMMLKEGNFVVTIKKPAVSS
ncbi:MAG: hypothetical protein HY344_04085 [Candidatus Levybacteria bacterium]|nr:hypothetical protein [Candidatus Levybacteria bacterium]